MTDRMTWQGMEGRLIGPWRSGVMAVAAIGTVLLGASCSAPPPSLEDVQVTRRAIVFGSDDRIDVYQAASLASPQRDTFQKAAAATAILVDQSAVNCPATGPCTLTTGGPTFNGLPLCSDQRFASQQAMSPPVAMNDGRNCSAFLVAPNVMMTSGACFAKKDPGLPFECRTAKVVFGFQLDASGPSPVTVPRENVFSCKAIVDSQTFSPDDPTFAVFTLDRAVSGRAPLAVRRKAPNNPNKLPDGLATLAVAGHPLGLPLKLAAGVTITDNSQERLFRATFDDETGGGGSPVFDYQTGQVEGIFTALSQPRFDVRAGGAPGGGDCLVYRQCPAGSCDGAAVAQTVTRVTFASENLVRLGDTSFQGPGSSYVVTTAGRVWDPTAPAGSLVDTDGDSLPDKWETEGVTVTVGGASVFVDLPAMGADPLHKDMFVQVDWMERAAPNAVSFQVPVQAMDMMRQSFEAAPVWNPDGEPGVRLHLDAGPGSKTWDRTARTWVDWPSTATAACGTGCVRHARAIPYSKYLIANVCSTSNCPNERTVASNAMATLAGTSFAPFGRDTVFYYGLSIDQLWQTVTNFSSGILDRTPGSTQWTYAASGTTLQNGFVVSLGVIRPVDDATRSWTAGGTIQERAQTTQHELGHSLGLYHFGLATNPSTSFYKPNYVSVMGYLFQLEPLQTLDYSRHELRTLTEAALDERIGIREPDSRGTAWYCLDSNLGGYVRYSTFEGPGQVLGQTVPGAVDWNCNGFGIVPVPPPEPSVSSDIDHTTSSVLVGSNDWANIRYLPFTSLTIQNGASQNGFVDEGRPDEIDRGITAPQRAAAVERPVPSFKVSRASGSGSVLATFDASASRDLQTSVASYQWRFGDGSTATASTASITHNYTQPGNYVAELSVVDSTGHASSVVARERVQVAPTASPRFFGFDDASRPWVPSGFSPVLDTGNKTEGTASLRVTGCGYFPIASPVFTTGELSPVGNALDLDVFIPATASLSNPSWVGAVQIYVDVPAAGLVNNYLGQVELTPLPRAAFSTIELPLTAAAQAALRGSFGGAHITVTVNSGSCSAPLLVDNLRFR